MTLPATKIALDFEALYRAAVPGAGLEWTWMGTAALAAALGAAPR